MTPGSTVHGVDFHVAHRIRPARPLRPSRVTGGFSYGRDPASYGIPNR
jgi:hypothetical protein